jgi:diacylglycerol kinase (ATP)
MTRKILFFINPISGTGARKQLENKIIKKCLEKNVGFELLFTSADGDYSFLKDKIHHDKITDIVICGGDGSLGPVISSILNVPVNIGIIPMGSGNGLALTAKIPRSFDNAFEIVFKGKPRLVDAFVVNNKFGCNLCGIGLDAKVAYDFSMQKKRGLTTYITQSFKNFFSASPYPFEIEIQKTKFKVNAFFICIANSNQFGNNFTIAPEALLDDGLLDIIVVKKMSKPKIIWSVFKQIQTGKLSSYKEKDFLQKDILYFQTNKLKILNHAMAPLHIDGDVVSTKAVFDIEILPAAFSLIHP